MIILLITLFAFVLPVGIYLGLEWRKSKRKEAMEGLAPRKKERVPARAVAGASAVVAVLMLPVYFASDAPYAHYTSDAAVLKLAFKHSGKRKADCAEADLIRKEGERYRKELKDTRQVAMDVAKIARCPRERHPVLVELYIDGQKALDKGYAPTGLKKDMASYIYDEFAMDPGEHSIRVLLYNNGAKEAPDHSFEGLATVKPGGVAVVWFDEKAGGLRLD